MVSSSSQRLVTFLCLAAQFILYPHIASGLKYEALVDSTNPIIPHAVRIDGNVTVSRGSNGMVSFVFRGLPNHETMRVNPNTPVAQDYMVELPEDPVPMAEEECLTGGPIGWTIQGVALYNPFNILGTNAVEGDEAETFDECQGHADGFGAYHYHQFPDRCVFSTADDDYRRHMVHGIARDGFPIYGPYKEDGTLVQETELDKCHGRCGEDGKYRYHMTKTYPYIMGCYRGQPMAIGGQEGAGGGPGGAGGGGGERPPPPEGGGTRPPPPDGAGPPPDGAGPPGGGGDGDSANKCAYNEVAIEFQTCSAYTGDGDNGSGHNQIAISLVLMSCIATWLFNLIH